MNLADSGILSAAMKEAGYQSVADPDQANVIILNTCSVREKAEERALGRLRELGGLKKDREVRICAVGCMAQRMGHHLREQIPQIDFVLGTERLFELPDILSNGHTAPIVDTAMDSDLRWAEHPPSPDNSYTAHVVITRGCNNYCSYCVVPYLRGPERHRTPESIINDINQLMPKGIVEITLVGQNVNSYQYGDVRFPDLIRQIIAKTGLKRVRFITSHPKDLSDDLISLFGSEPALMGHLHLPLQSGADRILQLMSRGYTYDHYRRQVEKLRQARPDMAISTDLIVGFPTETEEEFAATMTAVREIGFDAAFMFRYSVREGTWATENLHDDVSEEEKLKRLKKLIALQTEMSYEVNQREVGCTRQVLVDGISRRDRTAWKGKTEGNKTVVFHDAGCITGQIVPVRITRADSWTLHGEPIS